jgi:hypothetical protein
VGDDLLADAALVLEVEVLQGFPGREAGRGDAGLAACDWREETSRSRQAARKSSWLQTSSRARVARRSIPAKREGALSSRHR